MDNLKNQNYPSPPHFVAHEIMDEATQKALKRFSKIAFSIAAVIIALFAIVVQIVRYNIRTRSLSLFNMFLFSSLLVIIIFYIIVIFYLTAKLQKNLLPSNSQIQYLFYDNHMQIDIQAPNGIINTQSIPYTTLKSTQETKTHFFMRLDRNRVFIFSKIHFEIGTSDELYFFLIQKLPPKKLKTKVKR